MSIGLVRAAAAAGSVTVEESLLGGRNQVGGQVVRQVESGVDVALELAF